VMLFIRSQGHVEAEANLKEEACAHGIDGHRRLVFAEYQPWLYHTHGKRAADLVLDTTLKNGHTTILDALFAGVPMVTLEGNRMSNRAASSALHALRLHELTVNSIKEYVELAVALATDHDLLARLRATAEQHRLAFPLFDTRRFANRFAAAMRSAWHVAKSQRQRNPTAEHEGYQRMNLFTRVQDASTMAPHFFDVHDALGDDETDDLYEQRVRSAVADRKHILLHIGGQVARDGWWVVNIEDRANVDFVLPMDKLHPFPDSSVAAIYASHVLEHVPYGVDEGVRHTLSEWFRVLRPGGALLVSVPDLAILASLFSNDTLTEQERFSVMRMIHGGQINAYDIHKVGFNVHFLTTFLQNAGFCEIERVDQFGLFPDASSAELRGVGISLNVAARACKSDGEWIRTEFAWDRRGKK
jgi:predicted SAM-dependent methyltransferase